MPNYKTFTFARERINKMHGFVVVRCDYSSLVEELCFYPEFGVLVRSSEKGPSRNLVRSSGSEFGERIWPNPGSTGSEFGERKGSNPGSAGSEYGEMNGLDPGLAGSEFGEKTGLNPGTAGSDFGERNGPNPGLAGSEFGERNGPYPGLAGSDFGERAWPSPDLEFGFGVRRKDLAAAGSEFVERTYFFPVFSFTPFFHIFFLYFSFLIFLFHFFSCFFFSFFTFFSSFFSFFSSSFLFFLFFSNFFSFFFLFILFSSEFGERNWSFSPLRTRFRPGPFSELRTCDPVLFLNFEPARVKSSEKGTGLSPNLPNQGWAGFFLRTLNLPGF